MGGLLSELGRKIAERWLSLLVLPGVLYLAVAVAGRALGHRRALDVVFLGDRITSWAAHPAADTVGGQVVLLAAVLAGAAAVGLVVQALGAFAERLWLAADWREWPPPLARLAGRRVAAVRRTWDEHARAYHDARQEAARARALGRSVDPAAREAAYRDMARTALERPDRPTWSGNRLHAVAVRLERDHRLDIATVWPYLWLTVPEATRAEITTARQDLTRATALSAWALVYLPLLWWWWPAVLVSAALFAISRHRTRTATEVYATLLEATARLHGRRLAARLGLDAAEPFGPHGGDALTRHLAPGTPPRPV